MKIAICDDDLKEINRIKDVISVYFSEKLINTEIYSFENGEKLLNSEIVFDMAFLEIEMPYLNGVETGKLLKQKSPNIIVFIVTAYSNYLDDAFELGAYRFLQKPVEVSRLYRSLDAALLSISSRDIKTICVNSKSAVISTKSIVYCESYKRKTKVVTTEGEYISKDVLNFWKEKLTGLNFGSPHSSFIVNFNYLKSFNRKSLILSYSGKDVEISIAPKKQREFRTKIFLFAERGA